MKSIFLVLMLLASITNSFAQACCCTGAGANYSILPNLNKHVLGVRYSYHSYFSETSSLNPELDGTVTNQSLQTIELFGRFNLVDRLQLSVFMPVNFIHQQSKFTNIRLAGLGDMSLLLQYNVLNPLKCTGKKAKHQLRLGAGIKLPSGAFNMTTGDLFTTNLQLGTGSIDFPFNATYTFRFNDFGMNLLAGYKLNTNNSRQYRFGDKVQAGLNLFYIINVKEVQLMPTAGFNYDRLFFNSKNGRSLDFTGGDFLTTSLGFDVYYKSLAFSSSVSPAVMNHLNWSGENKNKFNLEVGVFYNFSIKQ